ncbi:MAG: HD domain-containing protein [Caldilineaceae bacterium]|nr:HD domain-containing protein [Caldilineaceae bacterium]
MMPSARIAQMVADVPNRDEIRLLWSEYDAGSTPEARLVRDADKLEMVHQALCYSRRGQKNLLEFWQGHRWNYALCAALFEELFAEFQDVAR